jgi:CubicO group peptidase (beta-lactamase class C family)
MYGYGGQVLACRRGLGQFAPMTDVQITGLCPPRFQAVRDAFTANFADGGELGARFSLAQNGQIVVDLMGGHADRARMRAFDETTLCSIFSVSKAIAGLLVARLVDAGKLDYAQTVASIWPEFAQAGKGAITIEQALSHQAGLSGFPGPMEPSVWFDWDAVCAKLAAMAPLWPPGTASGYHPVTFGFLAGEIFRRVDGRHLIQAIREDLAEPLGLDLWLGLPDAEKPRKADIAKPREMPKFGPVTEPIRAAFLAPWALPQGNRPSDLEHTEVLSANTYATAESLARLASVWACDGLVGGQRLLSPGMAEKMTAPRTWGRDLVLPFDLSWGAGILRNDPVGVYGPGQQTVGHSGWGGACLFADPESGVSGAYVMNKQSAELIGDPRAVRLIEAAYKEL